MHKYVMAKNWSEHKRTETAKTHLPRKNPWVV